MPTVRAPAMSEGTLSPTIAAAAGSTPRRSSAMRKSGGSGLPTTIGLTPAATATASTIAPQPAKGYAWSTVAGYTSFLAHSGGPPLSVFLLPQRMAPALLVGTSVVYWGMLNYAKLVPYAALGQFDTRNLLTSLVLLPLAPLGTRIGLWMNRHVAPLWFYRVCYALTFLIGAKLVWDGMAPWWR